MFNCKNIIRISPQWHEDSELNHASRVMYENWWIDVTEYGAGGGEQVDQNSELLLFCIINKQTNKHRIKPLNKNPLIPSHSTQKKTCSWKNRTILHRLNIIGRFTINNKEIPGVACVALHLPQLSFPLGRVHTYRSVPLSPMLLLELLACHQ